jgi:hypothetical protein
MERSALQGHEPFVGQRLLAIDDPGMGGAEGNGPLCNGPEVRLVRLSEISGVRVGDSTLFRHPGDRRRGIETTRKGKPHTLSNR